MKFGSEFNTKSMVLGIDLRGLGKMQRISNIYAWRILRAFALYSTVDDSSNVLESCPTIKKD